MAIEKFGSGGDIEELLAVRDRIEELATTHLIGDASTPRADLLDRGDAYQLLVEVPGVAQSNLEIALQGEELVVAGLRETSASTTDNRIVFTERPNGPFQRTVRLPGRVDRERATAQLDAGLLIVTLPKR
jgi:HSP20 family protein